jgi:cellobiose-specific phosphotransferase system component IIB
MQAGLSTGVLMQLSGKYASIQNFNTQLYDVQANKNNFRSTVFNVIVNPQINYYFNEGSNVFVAPNYRRNLQPVTVATSDLKQKYNVFGFNIGIRTRLK